MLNKLEEAISQKAEKYYNQNMQIKYRNLWYTPV